MQWRILYDMLSPQFLALNYKAAPSQFNKNLQAKPPHPWEASWILAMKGNEQA